MYSQTQYEFLLTPTNESATTSGEKGVRFNPGLVPHVVRGAAMILTSGIVNPMEIRIQKVSLASGSTAQTIARLFAPTTTIAAGSVVYKENLNVEVAPGEAVFANVPAIVSGAALFKAVIYVEPRWERPGNNTAMRATTISTT